VTFVQNIIHLFQHSASVRLIPGELYAICIATQQ